MKWSSIHSFVALFLAANYFAFQVELFEEEYEANHRQASTACSIGSLTLTWESFDKENAPKAFVVDADIRIQFLFLFDSDPPTLLLSHTPFQPIRDKSPPFDQAS
jgi:hypothetical protein